MNKFANWIGVIEGIQSLKLWLTSNVGTKNDTDLQVVRKFG